MSLHGGMSEADWEQLALEALAELAWEPKHGKEIAPGSGEREKWEDLQIPSRMLAAMRTLNSQVPEQYLQQALAEILTPKSNDAITENYRLHKAIVEGFRGITYLDPDGVELSPTIRLVSHDPAVNDWLAVHQVTVAQGEFNRRFDIVLYCNGMPVSVIELKRAGSKHADPAGAHAQLRTYLREFPMAFRFCVLTLVSDGITAKYGTPFTPLHHFSPWNVDEHGTVVNPGDIDGEGNAPTALEVAMHGLYTRSRFLDLQRSLTAFDEGADGLSKRIAKPHQYFAVTKALAKTIDAVRATARPASSGTPRAPANPWRWSSTPTWSSGPQSCSTRPSSSSPTAPNWTVSCSRVSGSAGCCPRNPGRSAGAPNCGTRSPTGSAAASTSPLCRSSAAPSRSANPVPSTRCFRADATSS